MSIFCVIHFNFFLPPTVFHFVLGICHRAQPPVFVASPTCAQPPFRKVSPIRGEPPIPTVSPTVTELDILSNTRTADHFVGNTFCPEDGASTFFRNEFATYKATRRHVLDDSNFINISIINRGQGVFRCVTLEWKMQLDPR